MSVGSALLQEQVESQLNALQSVEYDENEASHAQLFSSLLGESLSFLRANPGMNHNATVEELHVKVMGLATRISAGLLVLDTGDDFESVPCNDFQLFGLSRILRKYACEWLKLTHTFAVWFILHGPP